VRFKKPEALSYAKDFLYALLYGIRFGRRSEILVAGDNLLALAGVILRGLGVVRRVVYYMIDYTPRRFRSPLANKAYLTVDRLAAHRADRVWPLSDRIIQARFETGKLDPARVRWEVVPYGSHPVAVDAHEPYRRNDIAYMGEISRRKGAELFVPIATELRKKGMEARFVIIGRGDYLDALREDIRRAGMAERFLLLGYIENIREATRILSRCGVAIAPYSPTDRNSFTYYADPGKLKIYLGCGLPVVLTDVPPIAARIRETGAGMTAEYSAADLAAKIEAVTASPEYPRIRGNARVLGAEYAWGTVFESALATIR
jgi:glycosyltransferase involved in cell wall biosynthesis